MVIDRKRKYCYWPNDNR